MGRFIDHSRNHSSLQIQAARLAHIRSSLGLSKGTSARELTVLHEIYHKVLHGDSSPTKQQFSWKKGPSPSGLAKSRSPYSHHGASIAKARERVRNQKTSMRSVFLHKPDNQSMSMSCAPSWRCAVIRCNLALTSARWLPRGGGEGFPLGLSARAIARCLLSAAAGPAERGGIPNSFSIQYCLGHCLQVNGS